MSCACWGEGQGPLCLVGGPAFPREVGGEVKELREGG